MLQRFSWLVALAALFVLPEARAEVLGYYVGVDTQTTIPSGTYNLLPNPHANRLTLLFAHPNFDTPSSSHYHRKGFFTYTGPNLGASTPIVQNNGTITNPLYNQPSQLPEDNSKLPLTVGSGIYAGKIRSSFNPSNEYSLLTTNATFDLTQQPGFSPTTVEGFLYNSSAGRYNGSLGDTTVFLELVSITPGLNIGTPTSLSAGFSGIGSSINLGTGNVWANDFDPVFWADDTVPVGTPLSATFRLVAGGTNSGGIGNSAEFTHNFVSAVPEPGTYALLGLAGGALCYLKLRRRQQAALA
jgi:hypothetical protein